MPPGVGGNPLRTFTRSGREALQAAKADATPAPVGEWAVLLVVAAIIVILVIIGLLY